MAKQKKSESAGGLIVLIVSFVGAIILLVSFLAIFVLIGIWIHFERAIKRYPGIRGQRDLRLSPNDEQNLQEHRGAKKRIQQRIAEIDNRKQDLLVRKDGSFDSRNKEGRALNQELEALRSDLSACNTIIAQLDSWEQSTYSDWVTKKSGLFASRAALCSLPVSVTAFYFFKPALLVSLSELIERQTGLDNPAQLENFYGAFTLGVWSSMGFFLLLWVLSTLAAPKFRGT